VRNRKQREFQKAFVLTVPAFRGMIRALALPENELHYSVRCRDGSELHPNSLDEIFALPNPRSRAIDRITISRSRNRRTSDPDLNLDITFSDVEYAPVSYIIDGEDADVMRLSRALEDHLEPMFQKYSMMSVAPTSLFIGMAPFFAGVALVTVGAGSLAFRHKLMATMLMSAGFTLMLLESFAGRIRKSVFPSGAFCIGDGQARFEKSTSVRNQIGIAAVIAFLISVIAGVVANLLPVTR
jgi:hypothetical protein